MLINMDQDARIARGEVGSDTPAGVHTATELEIAFRQFVSVVEILATSVKPEKVREEMLFPALEAARAALRAAEGGE